MEEDKLEISLRAARDLKDYIGHALDQLEEKVLIDIQGFENQVTALCHQCEALDLPDKRRALPELMELLNLLNRYEHALRSRENEAEK